jgi:hypothetical protein
VDLRAGLDDVEQRKISCPVGNESPAVQPVAILTELSWLPDINMHIE